MKDGKDNGKVQVVEGEVTFTASNQSSKLRLSKGNYSIQKNNSGTQFGSYGNTQTDIWLMEVPVGLVATTTTIDASDITNTDVYTGTAAGSLTATVTETESGNAVSGATVTWTSSKENVATIDENGVVTLVAAGTTTITASYEGVSGEFGASSATYELTVTSSAPYVQPTEFEIGLNNALFGPEYTGSVSNITDANPIVGTQDNVTVTYAGGGNHYVNDAQIRFYPNNKLTFEAPDGYEIKEIVFTADGQWNATISADGGTYDSDTKTWTGSATSVLFTGSGSGQCRMSKAAITLGAPSADPMVTVSQTSVNVPYTGDTGILTVQYQNIDEIEADIQFYDETGAEVDANEYEVWLTVELDEDNNVNYIAIENNGEERKAYFKVYALVDNDFVYSDMITITQAAAPVVYTTIPDLFAAATSTATNVTITFNNWVISAVKGSNAYLTDNQGNGLIIYQSGHGFNVNDVLSGTASCDLVTYQGSAELKNLTASTEGLTVTIGGGTVTEQDIAIADLSGVNTGALVHYDGLTYDGTNLVDGDNNTIKPYNTLYSYTFEEGKTYNVTGIYLQFNTTKEILPRSADDIEEVVTTVTIPIKDGFTATTFSCDNALDFSNVEGITAYIITDENGKTQAVTTVPAGEGLYIEGAAGDYQIPVIASAAAITGNKLMATDGSTTLYSDNNTVYYAFGKQNGKEAFYKVPTSGFTPSANKAVLAIDAVNGAKEMIVIGGDVTGIESIENGTIVNDNYYTIDGKLVKGQPTQKGIYVVNGRKVVIK